MEAAIREGLFAFGREARAQGWEPPPFSLVLDDVTRPRREPLRARVRAQGGGRGRRARTAAEWARELDALEARLVLCGDDPRHVHARAKGSCPWCRIEEAGGPSFYFLAQGSAPDAFDLAATWRAIEAVLSPGAAPLPDPPPVQAERRGAAERHPPRPRAPSRAPCPRAGPLASGRKRSAGRARSRRRRRAVRRLEDQWKALCGDGGFVARKKELEAAKAALDGLKAVEEREWEELAARFREARLPDHLRTFDLEFARIPGLGPAEVARLAGRGITTAADIAPERLMAIRRIDLDLVRGLLLFRAAATRACVLRSGDRAFPAGIARPSRTFRPGAGPRCSPRCSRAPSSWPSSAARRWPGATRWADGSPRRTRSSPGCAGRRTRADTRESAAA